MTDLDALRRAVLAAPDDDLPRLVYADCAEESGDPEYAEFIRAQIELAKTPEYEPFAVYCHTCRPEWVTDGRPNPVPGVDKPYSEPSYRRGFGWRLGITGPRQQQVVERAMTDHPIGALNLGTGTLDQWAEFSTAEWLRQIRSLWFVALSSPNEPLRVLRESPFVPNVRDLRLEHTNEPSLSFILEDLFAAPLGRQLTALSMRHGPGSADEWVEAITAGGRVALTDFDLYYMGFGPAAARVFVDGKLAKQAEVLRLAGNPLQASGVEILAAGVERLRILDLSNTHLDADAAEALSGSPAFAPLRKLVLNRNTNLRADGIKALARSSRLAGLRSLGLAVTHTDNAAVRYLTRGVVWPNLVELDLTGNPIDDGGGRHLLTAVPAPDLTSLRLPGRKLSDGMKAELRAKFGDAVGFAE
jgi:uncharacterized protein (TIGR02996 family)